MKTKPRKPIKRDRAVLADCEIDLEMAEQIKATPDNPNWEPESIYGMACIEEPDANEIDRIVHDMLRGSAELTPSHRQKLRRSIVEPCLSG